MYREAINQLIKWKNQNRPLPLIILGARQVGKTWLMKEFGKQYFEKVAYISCEKNTRMMQLFSQGFNLNNIIAGLSIEANVQIEPEKTLIILDEIQDIPLALQSLKYFAEDIEHKYYIVVAGSLLGIALHQGTSFPVGKVDRLNMYPLTFNEFLLATGNDRLLELINSNNWEMISVFKEEYIRQLKYYYYVGGMPAAVNCFIETRNLESVRDIQNKLLADYEQDFSKHAPIEEVPRIRMVWNSIPSQLTKENKKFIYGVLKEGARAKSFEIAIEWLLNCGLCHKVRRVTKGGFPLKAYEDLTAFKLYFLDVGLLSALSDINARTILEGNKIFTEFKGALTEQYVCQQLITDLKTNPYYWSADNSSGEIDFIIQNSGNVIPIEAKAEENLQAKSLKLFIPKNKLPFGIRLSMSNYRKEENLINIPLYGIHNILRLTE